VIFLEVFGAVMGNIRVPVLGRVFAGFNEIRPIKRFFDYLFGSRVTVPASSNGAIGFLRGTRVGGIF
jgi:hypothetical protein